MLYLKNFFHNFLVVYFALHLLPGLDVMEMKRLPHLGNDLLFAVGLGAVNSLLLLITKWIDNTPSTSRLALIALGVNFVAFAVLKFFPLGIRVSTVEGYLFGSVVCTGGAFVLNYLQMKKHTHHIAP
jgi:riboflavin transporter FmnP